LGSRKPYCLIAAGGHALLVVLGGLIVRVDDGVGSHTVGVVGLGPGVDGVNIVEHGHGKEGEHLICSKQEKGTLDYTVLHQNIHRVAAFAMLLIASPREN